MPEAEAVVVLVEFVEKHEIRILNVAGPRGIGWPEGYEFALHVIAGVSCSGSQYRE
jgi:hypothetical protein